MPYGHYVETTDGRKYWFTEGCEYCQMSTGGQHEYDCPCKGIKIAGERGKIVEGEWQDRHGGWNDA